MRYVLTCLQLWPQPIRPLRRNAAIDFAGPWHRYAARPPPLARGGGSVGPCLAGSQAPHLLCDGGAGRADGGRLVAGAAEFPGPLAERCRAGGAAGGGVRAAGAGAVATWQRTLMRVFSRFPGAAAPTSYRFEAPSPIQAKSIPLARFGVDLFIQVPGPGALGSALRPRLRSVRHRPSRGRVRPAYLQ